jgi:hypothetical protein
VACTHVYIPHGLVVKLPRFGGWHLFLFPFPFSQVMHLAVGDTVGPRVRAAAKSGVLKQIVDSHPTPEGVIEAIFIRVLSRRPTAADGGRDDGVAPGRGRRQAAGGLRRHLRRPARIRKVPATKSGQPPSCLFLVAGTFIRVDAVPRAAEKRKKASAISELRSPLPGR